MKKQINTIESDLTNLGLELDDFYIVSFWKTAQSVAIQGHYSDQLFNKLSSLESKGFKSIYHQDFNQWEFKNQQLNINITIS
jgi:hypothetical protein